MIFSMGWDWPTGDLNVLTSASAILAALGV
jgi:hypothetical protein